eukprot:gb/GEZN01022215.1/.p1 GENE.gb/GEZN01022215.1/~~gb/GEZN01022215.1/.p1  ORF type:complete len:177 (+),score=8.24 gb/GEZN01022215.1/:78-608(+)
MASPLQANNPRHPGQAGMKRQQKKALLRMKRRIACLTGPVVGGNCDGLPLNSALQVAPAKRLRTALTRPSPQVRPSSSAAPTAIIVPLVLDLSAKIQVALSLPEPLCVLIAEYFSFADLLFFNQSKHKLSSAAASQTEHQFDRDVVQGPMPADKSWTARVSHSLLVLSAPATPSSF